MKKLLVVGKLHQLDHTLKANICNAFKQAKVVDCLEQIEFVLNGISQQKIAKQSLDLGVPVVLLIGIKGVMLESYIAPIERAWKSDPPKIIVCAAEGAVPYFAPGRGVKVYPSLDKVSKNDFLDLFEEQEEAA